MMSHANRKIKNDSGAALLSSLAALTFVAFASSYIFDMISVNEKNVQRLKIKYRMSIIEAKVRSLGLQASSYVGCSASDTTLSCALNDAVFTALSEPLPFAKCPVSETLCGLKVEPLGLLRNQPPPLVADLTYLNVRVSYTGTELSLRPAVVVMAIPSETLHSDTVQCPPTKPFFRGFGAKGALNCMALDDKKCSAPGEYIKSIDKSTMRVTCGRLDEKQECLPDEIISSFRWDGADATGAPIFTTTCIKRVDPFIAYGFTESLVETPAETFPAVPFDPPSLPSPARPIPDYQDTPVPPVDCGYRWVCSGPGMESPVITQAPQYGGTACPGPRPNAECP